MSRAASTKARPTRGASTKDVKMERDKGEDPLHRRFAGRFAHRGLFQLQHAGVLDGRELVLLKMTR